MDNLPTDEVWNTYYIENGKFAFRKMFKETSTPEKRKTCKPCFTLKPREIDGLPSAYQVYMSSVDEYDAATKIVPNMKIWDQLRSADWFLNGSKVHSFEGLKVWREHMKQRDDSLAKSTLQDKVRAGDVTAAKAILAENKTKKSVGRKTKKTKAEKETTARVLAFNKKQG